MTLYCFGSLDRYVYVWRRVWTWWLCECVSVCDMSGECVQISDIASRRVLPRASSLCGLWVPIIPTRICSPSLRLGVRSRESRGKGLSSGFLIESVNSVSLVYITYLNSRTYLGIVP